MEAVKALIENCWIDKKKDKELYIKVRKELPKCQKFFRERLGWTVINNEQILKLEKIPAHVESYMGITVFFALFWHSWKIKKSRNNFCLQNWLICWNCN